MTRKNLLFFSSLFIFFSLSCQDEKLIIENKTQSHKWTFIVYAAADNDLDYFARRNIEQMKKIG